MESSAVSSHSARPKRRSFRRFGYGATLALVLANSVINTVNSVSPPSVEGVPYEGVTLYGGLFFGVGCCGRQDPYEF